MFLSRAILIAALTASSAMAHSNMFSPIPRKNVNSAFVSRDNNACEDTSTVIPDANNFQRGQTIPLKWWWNNHDGGFIKMAIIGGVNPGIGRDGQTAFLSRDNIIQGQCYTRNCDRSGPDPGNTKVCTGHDLTFPNWLADGEYTLQWAHFSGYNSQGVATRSLPIYHSCANIRIKGGVPPVRRPADWVAPFFGGDQVQIKGQGSGPDRCAFKQFPSEVLEPTAVNQKNDDAGLIQFGTPNGWAVKGNTPNKRANNLHLPRLGHIARHLELNATESDK